MRKKEISVKRDKFTKAIWENSKRFVSDKKCDTPQYVEVDKIFELVHQYKDTEINVLNNVIIELKRWLIEESEKLHKICGDNWTTVGQAVYERVLDKLNELIKEGNKKC
jgi:hypothetical protein